MNKEFKPNTNNLRSAIGKLRQVLNACEAESDPERKEMLKMASAQAFEFTTEMSWKTMRKVLIWLGASSSDTDETKMKLFQKAKEEGLIDDPEKWLEYYRNRNVSSHNYGQDVADLAFDYARKVLPDAESLIQKIDEILNV